MEEGAKRFDFLTNFLKTRQARIKRHKMLSDHDSSKEIALFFVRRWDWYLSHTEENADMAIKM